MALRIVCVRFISLQSIFMTTMNGLRLSQFDVDLVCLVNVIISFPSYEKSGHKNNIFEERNRRNTK